MSPNENTEAAEWVEEMMTDLTEDVLTDDQWSEFEDDGEEF